MERNVTTDCTDQNFARCAGWRVLKNPRAKKHLKIQSRVARRPCPCRLSRILLFALLLVTVLSSSAGSTLVIAPPGEVMEVRAARAVLVFDPLTQSQTTILEFVIGPVGDAFGLLVATPTPPQLTILKTSFFKGIDKRLYPAPSTARSIDIEFQSTLGNLLSREVGDDIRMGDAPKALLLEMASITALGRDEIMFDRWILERGLTLTPDQSNHLFKMRNMGWSITGIYLRPTKKSPETLVGRTPVLALTFETSEAAFSTRGKPDTASIIASSMSEPSIERALMEISVISEWPARLSDKQNLDPFYVNELDAGSLVRWAKLGRAHPWTFKRDGYMTTFQAPRENRSGVLRFGPAQRYIQIRPQPQVSEDRIEVNVPLEAAILAPLITFWIWRRARRRQQIFGRQGAKLR